MPEEEEEEEEEAADGQEHCREANRPRHLILFKQLKRATLGEGGGSVSGSAGADAGAGAMLQPTTVRASVA